MARERTLRRWLTLLLALFVIVLTTGFLFVDLDQHGILEPPPPIAPRNNPMATWFARLVPQPDDDDEPPRTVFSTTSDGIRGALASRDDLLGACYARWIRGDSTAPHTATAHIHLQPGDGDLGQVTRVDLDTRAGGVRTMEGCVTEALAPLRFEGVPATGVVVLWTLTLPEPP